MSAPPYMKLYVADYLADTTHLTTREHGAYVLLLMAMWRAGGKLPAADAKLAAIAKCSAKEWTAIRATMLAFFRRRGSRLSHKRLAKELLHAETVSCSRKRPQNGTDSENANNNNNKAIAKGAHLNRNCPHNQNQSKREKDYNSPSPLTPRERAGEQPDGSPASRLRVVTTAPLTPFGKWQAAKGRA